MSELVLITGGTGKTGRRVAEQLSARGVAVRAVSRSTNPAFDWSDESSWHLPVGDGAAAWIDAEDIAAVVATLLVDNGHHGEAIELSGPRAVSLGEAWR